MNYRRLRVFLEKLITVLEAREKDNPEIPGEMINLASDWMKNSVQTIKNKYSWESYDQWIVSDNLFAESGCFNFLKAEVFSPEFLLEPDPKFGGVKPKRTYVGFKYQEGFSDHLPILLRFEIGDH